MRHDNAPAPTLDPLRNPLHPARLLYLLLAFALLGPAGPALADDDVPVDQLPAAVVKAIEQRFPGVRIEDAERKTRNGQTVFEVEIEDKDDDDKEVTVTPEGEILEVDD